MTKKHFNALAEQLASVRPVYRPGVNGEAYAVWIQCVDAVRRACAETNPAFNAARFEAACRGE